MKHEEFLRKVRDIVAGYVTEPDVKERLLAAKLVYGIGDGTYRGICYHGAWKNGEPKPTDMVEVAASGEESPVQLAGTTIHELGHVIAGSGVGHGSAWFKACEKLGLRKIQAAGTIYTLAHFVPEIRANIAHICNLTDGQPVFAASPGGFLGLPPMKLRPCPLGVGTRGGKSRGAGSGSRLRKFVCECEKPVIARVAADEFNATCNVCKSAFKRAPGESQDTELYLDPDAQKGLRPTRACAERLLWFRDRRLPELLAGVTDDFGMKHYEAAVKENPWYIAEMERQYLDAWRWEIDRYGNAAALLRPLLRKANAGTIHLLPAAPALGKAVAA